MRSLAAVENQEGFLSCSQHETLKKDKKREASPYSRHMLSVVGPSGILRIFAWAVVMRRNL